MAATRTETTTDRTLAQEQGISDEPVRLPQNHLACCGCGIAVRVTDDSERIEVTALSRAGDPPRPPRAGPPTLRGMVTALTRCADCTARRAVAAALLEQHPKAGLQLGEASALHRLDGVLTALAVIDQPAPTAPVPGRILASMLRNLSVPGLAARWSSRLAPVLMVDPRTCSPYPWAHVRVGARQQMRSAYGAVLRDRVAQHAPPVTLTTPSAPFTNSRDEAVSAGCFMCGVGQVHLAAAAVATLGGVEVARSTAWTPVTTTLRGQIERGHLCPDCEAARQAVGAMGPTTVERAYLAHLDATHQDERARDLRTRITDGNPPLLPTFALLRVNAQTNQVDPPSPSAKPWGHLLVR